jgi:hypothetical protein
METGGTKKMMVVWYVLIASLMLSSFAKAITWQDGGTYDIDYVVSDFFNYVKSSTTVNVLEGANFTGYLLASESGGVININGGTVERELKAGAVGVVNIYSGVVGSLQVGFQTSQATVYGAAFQKNGVLQDPSVTQIVNPNTNGDSYSFVLEVLDGGVVTMTIPVLLNSGCSLNLGWPQTSPEISVYPALLTYDFGEVEVTQSASVPVQIFNVGTADLNVSSVTLTGDAGFSIEGPDAPLVIAPSTSVCVTFDVTFSPAFEGPASAVVQIVSDDEDESIIEVQLSAVGVGYSPEIVVQPESLYWDLGDVETGQSATMLVQIYNFGTADLNVSHVTLTGDSAFTFTAGPADPLVIAPNASVGVDYEVTFAPSVSGPASAVVQILSDDENGSVIEISLFGFGIVSEVPPTRMIQEILDYFDASVDEGTLQGYGPGNSSKNRLKALRNMIESAGDLINAGIYDQAISQLQAIAKKTDGDAKPQDFVTGEAVGELNAKIEALIANLMS